MSAIATFTKIPPLAIPGLWEAAMPVKSGLFRAPKNNFGEYLETYGTEVADYPWSGYVLATLLVYLADEHAVDLMKSSTNEALAQHVSDGQGCSCFILSEEHAQFV